MSGNCWLWSQRGLRPHPRPDGMRHIRPDPGLHVARPEREPSAGRAKRQERRERAHRCALRHWLVRQPEAITWDEAAEAEAMEAKEKDKGGPRVTAH